MAPVRGVRVPGRTFIILIVLLLAILAPNNVSAKIDARMPVSILGASKNAKAINALIIAYNDFAKKENLIGVKDTAVNSENAKAFLGAVAKALLMLETTRAKIKSPMRGDKTAKTWSKNQLNAIKLIESAMVAEEDLLKNLKSRANDVMTADGGQARAPDIFGPKLAEDRSPPEWIVKLPYFTEQEVPADITKLSNAFVETGKGGGGSTVLYSINAEDFPPGGWRCIAKKDRTDTVGDKPTEYEFGVYRALYASAKTARIHGLAITYGWAWLNWGIARLEQMLMKPYTMDGLKIMKILDDFKTNGIVTDDEYWNVIAFLTQRLLLGIKSIHTHGYTHNDLKPDNFMIDAKGRVWLIDLNGASPLEVGPNAVTEEYMPAEVFRAAKSFFNSNKTTAWRYKNTALDVYLLGNTLIHMTACPQTYEKSSCKPDLQPAPTASESYDESWKDLISKLKAPNEDDRITVTAALTHDFLSEVDLAAAKTVVANIANHKTFIATWERTNRKKYRENVDVAKMKKRFADIFRRLKNKIEQYTEAATSKKVAQLVTLAEEVQGIIDDLDDKKERLIGGGLSPTDAALKLFEGQLNVWAKIKRVHPPPEAAPWVPPVGAKSGILVEAEKEKAKKPVAKSGKSVPKKVEEDE